MRAQGTSGTCGLAVELPPLGDRPRGSRVWCDFQYVGEYRPPFGDGPHGSHKGQCPLTPDCAPWARRALVGHESWLRSYRRDTTGATARGSGVISCQLASTDRHSATGLMARYKCQRGFETTLAFCAAKVHKKHGNFPTGNACVCPMPSAGARAAIGSGGKKPCPF